MLIFKISSVSLSFHYLYCLKKCSAGHRFVRHCSAAKHHLQVIVQKAVNWERFFSGLMSYQSYKCVKRVQCKPVCSKTSEPAKRSVVFHAVFRKEMVFHTLFLVCFDCSIFCGRNFLFLRHKWESLPVFNFAHIKLGILTMPIRVVIHGIWQTQLRFEARFGYTIRLKVHRRP